jgi:hypothetical protein
MYHLDFQLEIHSVNHQDDCDMSELFKLCSMDSKLDFQVNFQIDFQFAKNSNLSISHHETA